MKTMKLVLLTTLLVLAVKTQAQVSVNINVGTPPAWAPNAPVEVHYYYLPDIEVYYDVPARRYIYLRNGRWFRSAALPPHYRGYDLYRGRTIYLTDYRGNRPYSYFKTHKVKYKGNGKWKNHHRDEKFKGHRGKGHKKDRD
ncbi:hypothetical protein [Flavobacterium mekongense]|uniref:hypothetical protein n=2 Tax=Flavobacteriaceae TaxID=49546 RepID=UPI00399B8929